jgi:hypothetical protein
MRFFNYRYLFVPSLRLIPIHQLNRQMAFATNVTNCHNAHSLHIAHLIIIGFTVLHILATNATTGTATSMHVTNDEIIL